MLYCPKCQKKLWNHYEPPSKNVRYLWCRECRKLYSISGLNPELKPSADPDKKLKKRRKKRDGSRDFSYRSIG